jgi:hypothetical protein
VSIEQQPATSQVAGPGLFLNLAIVLLRHHMAPPRPASPRASASKRPSDVMAGAGGAAGPAPDLRHQPPGKQFKYTVPIANITSSLVMQ